jgi:hypothetical protein
VKSKRNYFLISLFLIGIGYTQQDSLLKRRILVWGSVGLASGVTYAYLATQWYSGVPRSRFHFFNDWHEWKQVDKVGHAYGAYQLGRTAIQLAQWTGTGEKGLPYYALAGFLFQLPIEVMDGFSAKWGASIPDGIANLVGSALAFGNQLLWQEQRLLLKYSFFPSSYASAYPEKLGHGITQLLKDYNAQTYWLSLRVGDWILKERWGRGIAIAVGYGADGVIGGYGIDPPSLIQQRESRQWYLGPDLQLSAYKTRSKWLNTLLFCVDAIRIPLPALEYHTRKGFQWHWIPR